MTQTILGLPIAGELPSDDNYTISPYSAIAVMKGIDSDGDEVYAVVMTENMSPVEGAGFARYLSLYADEMVRETFVTSGSSEEK
jgi:hypothetical protein